MKKSRRHRQGHDFRLLRFAAMGFTALVLGIGIGMMGSKLFRSDPVKPAPPSAARYAPDPIPNASSPPVPAPQAVAPPAPVPVPDEPLPAWRRFAVAAPAADGRPWIAVVIDDVGVDRKRGLRTIDLPGPLTISLMTYADDLPNLAERVRARGHELMLHVPMEPQDRSENPGPQALYIGHDPAETSKRLAWALDRLDGYVGINNHMGSRFTAAEPAMRLVLAEVKARGLLFLDSRTSAQTVGTRLAGAMGVPHVARDVFLDSEDRIEAIRAQIDQVEKLARKQGHAVAIGHPHDNTIAALGAWLPTLGARGFVLAPISAIVRRQTAG